VAEIAETASKAATITTTIIVTASDLSIEEASA
jgi:hypothetical protein